MVRVRRVASAIPFLRKYEIKYSPAKELSRGWHEQSARRGTAVTVLSTLVGTGDAWSFVNEADRVWRKRGHGWAVEYEEG